MISSPQKTVSGPRKGSDAVFFKLFYVGAKDHIVVRAGNSGLSTLFRGKSAKKFEFSTILC